jgi:hypothetical protein
MALCTFCQEDRTLTREHVWPQWLASVFVEEAPQPLVRRVGGEVSVRNEPMFKQTVRAVCRVCNSGWMSQLEERVKPVLRPMIRGMAVQLGGDSQGLIATWALKTAIMAQCAAGEKITPTQDALWLYHEQAAPDTNVAVLLAHYEGRRHPLFLAHKPLWFDHPWPRDDAGAEGYLTTVSVGELVCQIYGTRVWLGDTFRRRGWKGAASQQIWPGPVLQTWPPRQRLSDSQLHEFAESI